MSGSVRRADRTGDRVLDTVETRLGKLGVFGGSPHDTSLKNGITTLTRYFIERKRHAIEKKDNRPVNWLFFSVGSPVGFFSGDRSQENAAGDSPWETFGVNLGVFVSATDTAFRIGSGIDLSIDAEEALGLDATNTVFRTDALWRFTENKRHRLDFTWFSLKRDASRQIGQDITIKDKDGNPITIDAGTTVESNFDLDIYELAYSYSFFQDDRIDLAVGIGLFLMPLDFGLRASGVVDEDGSASFSAPLPALGLRMDVALTP